MMDMQRTGLTIAGVFILIMILAASGHPAGAADKFIPYFCEGPAKDEQLFTRGRILHQEDLPKLTPLMKKHRDFLTRFMDHYSTAELPTIVIEQETDLDQLSFFDLIEAPIPNFNTLRITARQIAAMGDYYRLTGHNFRAGRIYLALLKYGIDIGYGLGTVKTLINQMIAIAVQKAALGRLIYLLYDGGLGSSNEKEICEGVADLMEKRVAIREAYRFERATIEKFDFKEILKRESELSDIRKSVFNRLILRLFHGRATTALHRMAGEIYDEIERGLDKQFKEGRLNIERANQRTEEICKEAGSIVTMIFSPASQMARIIISIMTPNFSRAWEQDLAVFNYSNGLAIVHLLNEYRRSQGSYPETLDELESRTSVTLPPDVYTSEQLIYRPSKNGFVLYSPGGDGKDDSMDKLKDDPLYPPLKYLDK